MLAQIHLSPWTRTPTGYRAETPLGLALVLELHGDSPTARLGSVPLHVSPETVAQWWCEARATAGAARV